MRAAAGGAAAESVGDDYCDVDQLADEFADAERKSPALVCTSVSGATGSEQSRLILDTGANVHVFKDRHFFVSLDEPPPPALRVAAPGTHRTAATGAAVITLTTTAGGALELTLPGAVYAPDQPFNLLSLSQLLGQAGPGGQKIAANPDFRNAVTRCNSRTRAAPRYVLKLTTDCTSYARQWAALVRRRRCAPLRPFPPPLLRQRRR